jgi:sulfur carrier protein
MKIQLNGKLREIPDYSAAQDLIGLLGFDGQRLAMEINHEIVPRSQYTSHRLHDGDQVEIVHAIGGG